MAHEERLDSFEPTHRAKGTGPERPTTRGHRIQHHPAADGGHGAVAPDHEPVATACDERRRTGQPGEPDAARRNRRQRGDPRDDLGRAEVQVDGSA